MVQRVGIGASPCPTALANALEALARQGATRNVKLPPCIAWS
jgi:hypothetical protein